MFDLTSKLEDYIFYRGKKIPVDLAFDKVLRAYRLMEDEKLPYGDKLMRTLKNFGVAGAFSLEERAFLIDLIFARINVLGKGIDNYNFPKGGTAAKNISYVKDASLIYTAFLQGYGIDLYEVQGKLHWIKFMMLLNNIPEDTKLSKVIGYRTAKIPPANKYNRHEVAFAHEMRAIYRLEVSQEQMRRDIDHNLAGIFNALKSRAK